MAFLGMDRAAGGQGCNGFLHRCQGDWVARQPNETMRTIEARDVNMVLLRASLCTLADKVNVLFI
jgi:hypothetical protein